MEQVYGNTVEFLTWSVAALPSSQPTKFAPEEKNNKKQVEKESAIALLSLPRGLYYNLKNDYQELQGAIAQPREHNEHNRVSFCAQCVDDSASNAAIPSSLVTSTVVAMMLRGRSYYHRFPWKLNKHLYER